MRVAIGIDLGGTKLAGGVIDERGGVLARRELPTSVRSETTIVSGISKLVDELRAIAPKTEAVGVGCAGLIDDRAGVVVVSPNLPLRDIGLRDMLSARCGLPVVLENDANAAAYGEAIVGAGQGRSPVLCLTVGTGIGGGVVIDGALMRGSRGFAGEVGHIVVDPSGPLCACGQPGCLEAFASGNALGRDARARLEDPQAAALAQRASRGPITGVVVGELAALGDSFCLDLIDQAGRWLGRGIVGLVNILDPEVIVIGGGAGSGLADLLIGPALAEVAARLLGVGARVPPPVVPAVLGADAGLIGAGLLALGLVDGKPDGT